MALKSSATSAPIILNDHACVPPNEGQHQIGYKFGPREALRVGVEIASRALGVSAERVYVE